MNNQKHVSRLSTHTKRLNEIVSLQSKVAATPVRERKKLTQLLSKLVPLMAMQLKHETRLARKEAEIEEGKNYD